MGVVHLNLEPRNILFTGSGHLLISNFSCAYDTNHKRGPPQEEDYRGNNYYMAPEVASRTSISSKSDVWSFGALMSSKLNDFLTFVTLIGTQLFHWASCLQSMDRGLYLNMDYFHQMFTCPKLKAKTTWIVFFNLFKYLKLILSEIQIV